MRETSSRMRVLSRGLVNGTPSRDWNRGPGLPFEAASRYSKAETAHKVLSADGVRVTVAPWRKGSVLETRTVSW